MSDILSDENLIAEYLKGNKAAFETLTERHLNSIYGFIYKNIGSQADAEDVAQAVFIKVWKNLKKFDPKKKFKPWLFQIAKNASIDFLRKKKSIPFSKFENEKGQNVLLENIASVPFNIIGSLSDKRVILAAMRGLNHEEQRVILMRHNDGMSFKEIADIFRESVNTVKSRYRRSLLNLRKNIQN